MLKFEQALTRNIASTKRDNLKEFLNVDSDTEIEKTIAGYQNKIVDQKNIDMSGINYKKVGVDEVRSKKYEGDTTKIIPMDSTKTGKELFGDFQMYSEIAPPMWYEDSYGNVWAKT